LPVVDTLQCSYKGTCLAWMSKVGIEQCQGKSSLKDWFHSLKKMRKNGHIERRVLVNDHVKKNSEYIILVCAPIIMIGGFFSIGSVELIRFGKMIKITGGMVKVKILKGAADKT